MKFLYVVVMGITLSLFSQSSYINAQEAGKKIAHGAAAAVSKSTLEFINWADHIADLGNPIKLPVRYGELLWSTGNDLWAGKANSYWKMAGVLAIPVIPWLIWRLWIKKVYNKQCGLYQAVGLKIREHCDNICAITNNKMDPISANAFANKYPNERAAVIKNANKCKTLSTLYLKTDQTLVNLVDSFYTNVNNIPEMQRLCGEIQNCCAGIIKKYTA